MKSIIEKEDKLFLTLSYQKNEIIFKEDDQCKYIGIIISGEFEISSYSFNGKEMIYKRLLPYSFFGNNLVFSTNNFFKGNVICKKNGVIKLISKENFIYLLEKYPLFLKKYLALQSLEIMQLNNQIKVLSFDSAKEKLLFFLKSHNNQYIYNSVTSLAKELSIARETLSRLITNLIENNIIRKENNKLILL